MTGEDSVHFPWQRHAGSNFYGTIKKEGKYRVRWTNALDKKLLFK
jgi:hypothetical protein